MRNCKTCNELILEESTYCPFCGAKQIARRLTIPMLLNSLLAKLANMDFAFFNTSKLLLLRPEKVTNGYINGVRKVINSPMQYAIIVLSIYGLFQFFFSDFLNLLTQYNFISNFAEGWNSFDAPREGNHSDDKINEAINWFQSRNQFFIFLMIPCISYFSWKFYKKRSYNLAEHAVIAIYAVSFTLILSVLFGLILAPLASESAVSIYVNSSFILTTIAVAWIFKRTLKGSIFRPLVVLFLSFFVTANLLFIGLIIIVNLI